MKDNLNVMLVDDEAEFANTLAERLELRDIKVRAATDGETALAMIDEEPPDIVLLDVMMPGIGGLETLKRIRQSHPSVRVILLTGRGGTREGIDGMRHGAFDYMMKPVDLNQLMEKMHEAMVQGGQ